MYYSQPHVLSVLVRMSNDDERDGIEASLAIRVRKTTCSVGPNGSSVP